ncbi:uncharacterized protein LOC100368376 [Saccoglossus kowalevskii]|uniref:Palmitoyltransferase n=1 Tax=Saccoglossus kowalevskii TaxID=10224 RepID=A0ABM0ME68_SACKO|nr:PREDICTED: probable protein S-acyltransferase 23-like [Saccoglossus kowalevskii]
MAHHSHGTDTNNEKGIDPKSGDEKKPEEGGQLMRFPIDIFQASKTGYLIRVQELVEENGPELLLEHDDKGHTPVHWAALGGFTNIIRFMVDYKINMDIPSNNDLQPRPIHWAAVNGHIAVVDILLQAGVSIDTTDAKGCTPLIIACQYGQTMLAGYLMGKGARLQLCDKEGDNALHWAAFKGYCELTRLLIYSGFNPRQRDTYGQTPLHLATLSGDLLSVKMLCEQDGVDFEIEDNNHKTPLMLSQGRKHTDITNYLNKKLKNQKSLIPHIDFKSIVFGPPGKSKAPLLFFLINVLCWGYPMYIFKGLITFPFIPHWHYIFIAVNCVMWYSFYKACLTDPGFFQKNSADYDRAIKQVAHFDEWKQGKNPLTRLCHTCRIVKPLRTKHCKICNRCVMHFDHHCPYIYNCVGYYNRHWFVIFVSCIAINAYITEIIAAMLIKLEGMRWLYVIGFLQVVFFGFIAVGLTCATWCMAAFNITTNERMNWKRYDYLKDAHGHYHNPYNKGIKRNVQEFFHVKPPPRDDEVNQSRTFIV